MYKGNGAPWCSPEHNGLQHLPYSYEIDVEVGSKNFMFSRCTWASLHITGLDSILQVASFVRSSGLVIGDDNGFILIS